MSFTEEDKIGRQDIVDKISSLVDNLQEDEHFCLALNGEWGSGKSYVMDMLREKFAEREEYIVINYDAWKNNFYSDPLIAILYCILDSIPKQKLGEKNLHLVMREVKQLARDKIVSNLDSIIEKLCKMGGWSSVCAFVMEIIKQVIKQAKISILDNKLFDNYKSYQTLLNESIAVLNALTWKKTDDGIQRRLIILVDEIDRCLPNEQLICLERIHHLFDVKNCAVIVALNKSAVKSTFYNAYKVDGESYLRKFFDFTCIVDMRIDKFLNYLLTKDLLNRLQKLQSFQNNITLNYLQVANRVLLDYLFKDETYKKFDNRSIRRFYNFLLQIFDLYGWEKLNIKYVFVAIVCLFIERFVDSKILEQSKNRNDKNFIAETLQLDYAMNGRAYDLYAYDDVHGYKQYILNEFNLIMNRMVKNEGYTVNVNDMFLGVDGLKILKKLLVTYGAADEK